MKRIVGLILILLIGGLVLEVHAENYKIKELIPKNIETTIHTNNFSYKGLYFDDEGIHFKGIKNLTDQELPITISIGLFNKEGRNVGTINYCGYSLNSKEEMSYLIKFKKKYLSENSGIKDIRYISVLGDNINCRREGSLDYIGKGIDTLGISSKYRFTNDTEIFLTILSILGSFLIILFLYKFLFSKKYYNIDGRDVRNGYKNINEELRRERKEKKVESKEKNMKISKPAEIIKQEKEMNSADKNDTDLHNLYK
ncbi:MAG: hypothetical protein IJ097_03865 [Bacilli bacterium]|nr:hypothetical protein [Bacilli bacterium]